MPSEKTRVLIIDDEPDFCYFVQVNLQEEGSYEVLMANSAEEGLRMARQRHPDIILLDVMMPGMDGLELLKRLKKEAGTLSIPVLMLSAVTDPSFKQQAASLYDEAYIEKPVEIGTLKSRIETVLSQSGARRKKKTS